MVATHLLSQSRRLDIVDAAADDPVIGTIEVACDK
jgi:hypothetical protein